MTVAEGLRVALSDRYRLERELGQGGMATVYLAEDLKHDRKVAIKVLRPELAAVLGAERFVQEIKTTAALQHPHILPLFDSGSVHGPDKSGPYMYYVMPYMEGETIREKLDRETQFGIEEAVRITTEVADALDYAHRHGVIHRDIKPENILLHDGRPMVMDFGIALAVSAAAGGRMTETGLSLGTPHYMSPEQATADRDITARSDIYSLASVLYEMLSGEPPHMGTSAQQIIMKIVTETAAPVTKLRKSVPSNVSAAVAQALEKLPADRFDTAKTFADALANPAFTSANLTASTPASEARLRVRLVGVSVVTALLAVVAIWGWLRPSTHVAVPQPPTRLAIPLPNFGGAATGLDRQLTLSPDGSTLIFTAIAPDGGNRTMRLPLTDTLAVPIAGAPPFLSDYLISPDGREIVGKGPNSRVYRFPVAGGNPRILPEAVASTQTAIWRADGSVWFTSRNTRSSGLVRMAPDGSLSRPFGERFGDVLLMQELPDRRHALAILSSLGTASGPVLLFDMERGDTTVILNEEIVQVRFTSGYLVLARTNGSFEAIPFDPDRLRITDTPIQLATGVNITGTGSAQFAVSDNGTVAYVAEAGRTLVLIDRQGRSRLATPEERNYHAPMFSPDGRRLSLDFSTADGRDVWTLDLGTGALARATFFGDGHDATWSPDGRWLTVITVRSGADLSLFRVRPGQAESAESLFTSPTLGYSGLWLPDGSALVTAASGLATESLNDIGIIRNAGTGPLEPLVAGRFLEQFPAVSPDGRWVAFSSTQSGRNEVYIRALDGTSDQVQVSISGGVEPVWGPGGRELFYRAGEGVGTDLVAATITVTPNPAVIDRKVLFAVGSFGTATPHRNYDISPDGQTFAFVSFNRASRVMIIQNLPALVNRLRGGAR